MKKEIPNFIQNFLNKHKNFKSDHSKMASFDIIIRLQSVFLSEKYCFRSNCQSIFQPYLCSQMLLFSRKNFNSQAKIVTFYLKNECSQINRYIFPWKRTFWQILAAFFFENVLNSLKTFILSLEIDIFDINFAFSLTCTIFFISIYWRTLIIESAHLYVALINVFMCK